MHAMMRDIATTVIYPRAEHFIIVAALAPILRLLVPVLRDADSFIERILRPPRIAARAVS